MPQKRKGSGMLAPTIVMGLLAIILIGIAYQKGGGQHLTGLKIASNMIIQLLSMLIFAFIIASMIQVLLPYDTVSRWVGAESGMRGILIGALAGGFSPGGPYVNLPIAIGLMRAGAGVGTIVAFLTGWSLWAVARLPMELGILGWKLTLIRIASTLIFPPIAGIIAQTLFGGYKI